MEFNELYKLGIDALRFVVLPLAAWVLFIVRRISVLEQKVTANELKLDAIDVTALAVTLAEIQKDLQHIREVTDRLDLEQNRQREFLNKS